MRVTEVPDPDLLGSPVCTCMAFYSFLGLLGLQTLNHKYMFLIQVAQSDSGRKIGTTRFNTWWRVSTSTRVTKTSAKASSPSTKTATSLFLRPTRVWTKSTCFLQVANSTSSALKASWTRVICSNSTLATPWRWEHPENSIIYCFCFVVCTFAIYFGVRLILRV